jgi:hypothetical protein
MAVYRDLRAEALSARAQRDSALRRDQARVVRIVAQRVLEVEDDEAGPVYAFHAGPDRIFLVGTLDLRTYGRFPSTEFTLVEILDELGRVVDQRLDAGGEPLTPTGSVDPFDLDRPGLRRLAPDLLEGPFDQVAELARRR